MKYRALLCVGTNISECEITFVIMIMIKTATCTCKLENFPVEIHVFFLKLLILSVYLPQGSLVKSSTLPQDPKGEGFN